MFPIIMNFQHAITLGLFGALLSSCMNMGGALDNIGKTQPELRPTAQRARKNSSEAYYAPERRPDVYRKDGRYYVRLEMVYCPAHAPLALTPSGDWGTACRHYYSITNEEKNRYPSVVYYAVLTPEQYEMAGKSSLHIKDKSPLNRESFPVLPADEVNLEGAELLKPKASLHLRPMASRVPSERTWGNRLRYPLVLVAHAADIPLSLACMPVTVVWVWLRS